MKLRPGKESSHRTRSGTWATIAGLVVAAIVFGGGLFALSTRSRQWSATVSVIVLPSRTITGDTAASYYDTLSQGQVTQTFAEVLRLDRFKQAAARSLRLTPEQSGQVTVRVDVVPNTTLLAVTASAPRARTAEAMADSVFAQAAVYLATLSSPYELSAVNKATGTATRPSAAPPTTLAVLFLASIAVGVGVRQLTILILPSQRAYGRIDQSQEESDGPPATDPAFPSEPTIPWASSQTAAPPEPSVGPNGLPL